MAARAGIDRRTLGRWALTGAAGVTLGLILLPLVFVAWLAFFRQAIPSFPPQGYSIKWFLAIADSPRFVDGFWLSLRVAGAAMLIGLVIGVPAALCLARYRFWAREPIGNLLLLPLVVPGIVLVTLQWIGIAAEPIRLMYTEFAVIVGILAVNLPYVVLTLQSVIEGIDQAVEDAAFGLGAGPFTMLRRVLLPLALHGFAAGAIFCFILTMNAYATPVLLGGPQFMMMGPLVYVQFAAKSNWPFGAAVSFILMAATLVLTAAANLMVQRRYRT